MSFLLVRWRQRRDRTGRGDGTVDSVMGSRHRRRGRTEEAEALPVEEPREPLRGGERLGFDQVRLPHEPSGEDSTAETPGHHLEEPAPAGEWDEPESGRAEAMSSEDSSERVEAERVEGGPAASEWVSAEPTEPVRVEPVRVEPVRVEPVRVEPVRVEPEPALSERIEPEPAGPEWVGAGAREVGPVEPVRLEPGADRSEPISSERVDVEPVDVEPVELASVGSEWVGAGPVESKPVGSGPAVSESAANNPVEERVRQQVATLVGIENRPLAEHAQRYDEVHAELQAALTEIDGESGG